MLYEVFIINRIRRYRQGANSSHYFFLSLDQDWAEGKNAWPKPACNRIIMIPIIEINHFELAKVEMIDLFIDGGKINI